MFYISEVQLQFWRTPKVWVFAQIAIQAGQRQAQWHRQINGWPFVPQTIKSDMGFNCVFSLKIWMRTEIQCVGAAAHNIQLSNIRWLPISQILIQAHLPPPTTCIRPFQFQIQILSFQTILSFLIRFQKKSWNMIMSTYDMFDRPV